MKNLIIKLWKSDVKTSYCIYENCSIWELGEFEKNKIMITWPVLTSLKTLYIIIIVLCGSVLQFIYIVLPRSFHTNINYFRGTVKKEKIWGGKCEMWNKQN
jgi:hypothetical protein